MKWKNLPDNMPNGERASAFAGEAERLLREAEHGSGEAYRALGIRAAGYASLALYYRDLPEEAP
jgi:hypothetical protein